MDYANYWASAIATADLGDTIEQSLRFHGGTLSRSQASNDSVYSISWWVKRAELGSNQTMLTASFKGQLLRWASDDKFEYNHSATSGKTTQVFRDPSAWYHCLLTYGDGGDVVKFFVNGVNTNISMSAGGNSWGGTVTIGNAALEGYMAEMHYISGSIKATTDFGKYNDDGVWVPQDYTGTYGTNGFHLKFDSSGYNGSGGIGADHSGNGNDFTASGFDEGPVGIWSDYVFTTSSSSPDFTSTRQNFFSTQPQTRSFDGNSSTAGQSLGGASDGVYFFRPPTAIPNVTKIEMKPTNGSGYQYHYINGTQGTFSSSNVKQTIYSGSAITLTSVGTDWISGNTNNGFYQLWINEVEYIDNFDNDVDYLDTPTSNYGTFNGVNKYIHNGLATLEGGNLKLSALSADFVDARSSIAASDLDCYCEMTVTELGSSLAGIGVGSSNAQISLGVGSYITYRQNGAIVQYPGNTNLGTLASYTDGDIIGMTISSTQVAFYKNGTLQGTYTHNYTFDFFVIGMAYYTSGNSVLDFNFGQMPFIYTVPTGFKALQTNNLAEPTIKNGKDYFDVVTWSGDGTNGRDITGLEFQPDLVWIKCRNRALNHNLYDSVRGVTKHLTPNENYANQTTANSLTAFNSDGFQVGTGASDNTLSPASNYVAWCWKAGGTAVSNTDGTIASSVSANTDAGFSIVSWTGTQTASQTVGHGLSEAPDLVIYKARDEAANWIVGSSAIGATEYLILDVANAKASNSTYIPSRPTNSVLNLGSVSSVNNDEKMIAYCWHSVEGFSKIGSYTGNSSADGPFIYTGFKIGWLMVKSTASAPWAIWDSTRKSTNPNDVWLEAHLVNTELSGYHDIDFLSNGFKVRYNSTYENQGTLLYMAFAENPFGGENAPPATAR